MPHDYTLTIDGKPQKLHWGGDVPPTDAEVNEIVRQYHSSPAVSRTDKTSRYPSGLPQVSPERLAQNRALIRQSMQRLSEEIGIPAENRLRPHATPNAPILTGQPSFAANPFQRARSSEVQEPVPEAMTVGPVARRYSRMGTATTIPGRLASPAASVETDIGNMPADTAGQYAGKLAASLGYGAIKGIGLGTDPNRTSPVPEPSDVLAKLLIAIPGLGETAGGRIAELLGKSAKGIERGARIGKGAAVAGIGQGVVAPEVAEQIGKGDWKKAAIAEAMGMSPVVAEEAGPSIFRAMRQRAPEVPAETLPAEPRPFRVLPRRGKITPQEVPGAVQEQGPAAEVPRARGTRRNKPQGGQGVRSGDEGQVPKPAGARQAKAPKPAEEVQPPTGQRPQEVASPTEVSGAGQPQTGAAVTPSAPETRVPAEPPVSTAGTVPAPKRGQPLDVNGRKLVYIGKNAEGQHIARDNAVGQSFPLTDEQVRAGMPSTKPAGVTPAKETPNAPTVPATAVEPAAAVSEPKAPAGKAAPLPAGKAAEPSAAVAQSEPKGPTPDRSRKVIRGMHGPVDITFPDADHASMFDYAGKFTRAMRGKGPYPDRSWAEGLLGKDALTHASDYRDKVLAQTKGIPEGTRIEAPEMPEIKAARQRFVQERQAAIDAQAKNAGTAKSFGSENKVFTEDRRAAAVERLKGKMNRLSAGVDPTVVADLAEIGGYYAEGGIRSFAQWAKQVRSDVPSADDEHLKAAWAVVQKQFPAKTPETVGVAQRVQERMAGEGKASGYTPGAGTGPDALVQRGRDLLANLKRNGQTAEDHLASMKARGGAATPDDIGILRAHYEDLQKAQDRAIDQHGYGSSQQKAAFDEARKWYDKIQPYHTELSESFRALQGETEVDTGTFHGIARAFHELTKRTMTPKEQAAAEGHATKVGGAEGKVTESATKLDEAVKAAANDRANRATGAKTRLPSDPAKLRSHFEQRIANGSLFRDPVITRSRQAGAVSPSRAPRFTPEEVRAVWEYTKSGYIDPAANANMPIQFDDMVNGVARDLGLEPDWVRNIVAGNKTTRAITNEMYRRMDARDYAVQQAKAWLKNAAAPGYAKVWSAITNLPRGIRVFGHGTVGMETHAGPMMFSRTSWNDYWPNFFRQWKYFLGNSAIHQAAMQDIVRHPNFGEWKRAGLAVDPREIYDNYQQYGRFLGKIGKRGNMGMDALKNFRLDYAERLWNGLSPEEKADPNMRVALAKIVNHASGATDKRVSGTLGSLMFAPSLEFARWNRYGDIIRSMGTVVNWKNATPSQRAVAKWTGKRVLEIGATYMGALAANNALLKQTGQKDRVNFTDPSKSDWMKFKWDNRTLDPTGGAAQPARLVANVLGIATGQMETPIISGKKVSKRDAIMDRLVWYGQGKATPAIGVGMDVLSQQDMMGRPYPFSSEEGTVRKPKYTWGEYAWSQGPIPFSGAAQTYYDSLREQGVDKNYADAIMRTVLTLAIESTGTRVGDVPKPFTITPEQKAVMEERARRKQIYSDVRARADMEREQEEKAAARK